jgi:uncharacterized protein (TIGR03382 family)
MLTARRLLWALGVLLVAVLASASTCENQDYLTGPAVAVPTDKGMEPATAEISHPYDALTTVDYIVYNTGTAPMTVEVSATTLTLSTDDTADATTRDVGGAFGGLDLGTAPEGPVTLGTTSGRTLTVTAGSTAVGRFSARDLGTGISVTLEVACISSTCDGRIEWVILLGQVECRSDEDCAADEICDSEGRTCVEQASGCSTVGGVPPTAALFFLLGLAAVHRIRRRGTRPSALHKAAASVAVLILLGILLIPSQASAQRSVFDRATAQLSVGSGIRTWTGQLADDTKSGVSLNVVQGIQYRNLGFQLTIGTTYYLTTQQAPPLSKGLQTYSLRLGPRFYLPVWIFQIYADAEYERLGFISNSLVRVTGEQIGYHGVGAAGGFRWVPAPFFVDLRAGYTELFGLKSGQVSFALSVGLAGEM